MEELSTIPTPCTTKIQALRDSIAQIIVGQTQATDLLLTSVIARGHVLIEGVPGVAKTLLARVMAQLIDARFSRVQFTPDLMPSDVLGTTVYNMKTGDFDFHPGPVFADVVLADEINRAPAKTQAALFEVMEERQVTVDGTPRAMSDVFTIIATQNPVEQEGTYKLPEAQLDRFLVKITMDYPTTDEEVEILLRHQTSAAFTRVDRLEPLLTSPRCATPPRRCASKPRCCATSPRLWTQPATAKPSIWEPRRVQPWLSCRRPKPTPSCRSATLSPPTISRPWRPL